MSDLYGRHLKQYMKDFGFKDGGFSIVVPKDCETISMEGIKLHHCVGTYVERVSKGQTVILFVRQNDAIDKPFYTMEVSTDKRLVQCRGMSNCDMTDDVRAFVRLFCEKRHIQNNVA